MKTRPITLILIFAAILALASLACNANVNLGNDNRVVGSGKIVTQTRDVSGFDKVTLEGSGQLYITQGDKEALTIEADDNLMTYLTSDVTNGRLVLGMKPNLSFNFLKPIVYRLTVKDLHEVQIAGSGKVVSSSIHTTDFTIGTAGSGNYQIDDLQTTKLTATTGGSGEFKLTGKADDIQVTINGSGKFDCPDLQAQTGTVTINGSGNVTAWVANTLTARINGSGSVRYYGSPRTDVNISGSGSVQKAGDK